MDAYFNGKVAVVTGAGGTICSQISKNLAAIGVKVILVGRNLNKLKKVEQEIAENGGLGYSYECDVTSEEEVEKLASYAIGMFGKCDYLINGAGGNDVKAMPNIEKFNPYELEESQPDGLKGFYNVDMKCFERVIRLNTMGTVYPIRAFSKYMIQAGVGSIINFASMNSYCPLTRNFAYAMSKAAVVNMTQSFAAYFGETGIRINAVAPGFVVNERSKGYLGTVEGGLTGRGTSVIKHTPMKKFGEAEDMFGCVKWLLDERASGFVTGITVPVDGGFLTLSGV